MTYIVNLENFQGPFDLLLDLLRKKKLAITDLSIGGITKDYLDYISDMDTSLEELSSFLVVAAKLTLDKSLAVLMIDNEDEELDIEQSLIRYAHIKSKANQIATLLRRPYLSSLKRQTQGVATKPIDSGQLAKTYYDLRQHNADRSKRMTIKAKGGQLEAIRDNFLAKIKKMNRFSLDSALKDSSSKTEAIVGLMTMLELIRTGSVKIKDSSIVMEGSVS